MPHSLCIFLVRQIFSSAKNIPPLFFVGRSIQPPPENSGYNSVSPLMGLGGLITFKTPSTSTVLESIISDANSVFGKSNDIPQEIDIGPCGQMSIALHHGSGGLNRDVTSSLDRFAGNSRFARIEFLIYLNRLTTRRVRTIQFPLSRTSNPPPVKRQTKEGRV